jgi:hypothetical protein
MTTWKIRLETDDGEVKEFTALSCYEITEEQKARWVKPNGEEMKVTGTRIKAVVEKTDAFLNRR